MTKMAHVDSWFAEYCLNQMLPEADDSQEWAFIKRDLSTVDDEASCSLTLATVEAVLDSVIVPESNCSCHISPPCSDCVDYAGIREYIEYLKLVRDLYEENR